MFPEGTYNVAISQQKIRIRLPTGPRLNIKTVCPDMGISNIKIRRFWDLLIFVMGIPIQDTMIQDNTFIFRRSQETCWHSITVLQEYISPAEIHESVFWGIYNVLLLIMLHHGVSVQKPLDDKFSP